MRRCATCSRASGRPPSGRQFIEVYDEVARAAGLYPSSRATCACWSSNCSRSTRLLYELRYELQNRPGLGGHPARFVCWHSSAESAGQPTWMRPLHRSCRADRKARPQEADHGRLARPGLSPRRELGRRGRQFLAVLGERREGRAVHLRRVGTPRAAAHRAARADGQHLARLSARGPARAAVRLSGPRPLRSAQRAPLQPPQAAAGSLRQAHPGHGALERRPFRLQDRPSGCRPVLRHARQRVGNAQVPRDRPGVHLGRRSPAAHAAARHGDLRAARPRLDDAASRGAAGAARHLCRARDRADDRSPAAPRRDGGGADARARVPGRPAPGRPRAAQLLGLQHHRLLRAGHALFGHRPGQRIQDDGQDAALRRHRGDPRRGLQPHRRGQSPRPDAVVPRHRQRTRTIAPVPRIRATTWISPAAATR